MIEVHCEDCKESFGEFEESESGRAAAVGSADTHKCPQRCPECGKRVSAHTMDDGEQGGLRRMYCP